MNEPAVFDAIDKTFPKSNMHYQQEHRDIHNIYGHLNAKATHEALLERGKERPFILTRSYYAGTQQYSAVWSGDSYCSWEHYWQTIPMLLQISSCGVTFVGSDVPGFFNDPICPKGKFDEMLVLRWYQLGCFMPFYRAHANCDTKRREPYLFSEKL